METPIFGRRDPDARGYYGAYGGRFVPETLVAPIEELTEGYLAVRADPAFRAELDGLLAHYVGRPTPVYETRRLIPEGAGVKGVRLLLKREDLTHTGAHKINNAMGQALLAKRMGKRRVVAETGAGQHGVATATACALLGLECDVYMGSEDMRRQALNVVRMRLLGASVRQVDAGSRTLKDAINEAMRDWVTNVKDTYYLLGSALGPHPYPLMVREFQSVIGREARAADAVASGPAARRGRGVRGRRQQRHRHLRRLHGRQGRAADRRRGRRRAHRPGTPRRAVRRRQHRRAAGHPHVRAAGRGGQHRADALDLGRAGLCRRGTRARLAARSGPLRVRLRDRCRGARRLPGAREVRRASCPRSSRRTPWPTR